MAFKENLLKKIMLDTMKSSVLGSIGQSGSGKKIDRQAMVTLLDSAGYSHQKVRSLDLYLPEAMDENGTGDVVVLDNELTVYRSTISDVLLRKDPTLKEMISIRNAIKILNDSDVVVSRRGDTVETVHTKAVSLLDLSFGSEEIKQLEYDGRAAVEWKDTDAVLESLSLFCELLDYRIEPGVLRIEHHYIRGLYSTGRVGKECFGPSVIYDTAEDVLKLVTDRIEPHDKESVNYFKDVVKGVRPSELEGTSVIRFLSDEVFVKCGIDKPVS